jgi:hypothetical protein
MEAIIERGYWPSLIGNCTEMYVGYYLRRPGFGYLFESKVSSELAESEA